MSLRIDANFQFVEKEKLLLGDGTCPMRTWEILGLGAIIN